MFSNGGKLFCGNMSSMMIWREKKLQIKHVPFVKEANIFAIASRKHFIKVYFFKNIFVSHSAKIKQTPSWEDELSWI